LLAAASAVRRAGLETLIRQTPLLRLAGSLHGLLAITQYVEQLQPEALLLDLENESRSLESRALAGIPASFPVVALVDQPTADWAARALRSGVKAILPRDSGMDEILSGIQAAYAGLVLLDAEVTQTLAARIPTPAVQPAAALDDLTAREVEVLRMLAEGLGNRDMAGRLGISDHTVKFHISSILDKLGASTRTEAVTMGIAWESSCFESLAFPAALRTQLHRSFASLKDDSALGCQSPVRFWEHMHWTCSQKSALFSRKI
jgi:two-component system, NarL family, response regulator YdfI